MQIINSRLFSLARTQNVVMMLHTTVRSEELTSLKRITSEILDSNGTINSSRMNLIFSDKRPTRNELPYAQLTLLV